MAQLCCAAHRAVSRAQHLFPSLFSVFIYRCLYLFLTLCWLQLLTAYIPRSCYCLAPLGVVFSFGSIWTLWHILFLWRAVGLTALHVVLGWYIRFVVRPYELGRWASIVLCWLFNPSRSVYLTSQFKPLELGMYMLWNTVGHICWTILFLEVR